ncbi:MAG: hypothetical protein AMXMBFR61_01470 [Fimbriimonadales bacterium]
MLRVVLAGALTVLLALAGCIPKEAGYDEMGRRIKKTPSTSQAAGPSGERAAGSAAEGSASNGAPRANGETATPIEAVTRPPDPAVVKQSSQCAEHMLELYSHIPEVQAVLQAAKPKTVEDVVKIVNVELEKRLGKEALACPITGQRYQIMDQKAMQREKYAGIIADAQPHPDGTRFVVSLKLGQNGRPEAAISTFDEAKRVYSEARYRMPDPGTPARKCLDTINDLARAIGMYAQKHDQKVPEAGDSLTAKKDLMEFRPLLSDEFWVCPINKKPYAINYTVLNEGAEALRKRPPNTVALIYDSAPHPDGSRCVLANGSIARMRAEEFAKLKR